MSTHYAGLPISVFFSHQSDKLERAPFVACDSLFSEKQFIILE